MKISGLLSALCAVMLTSTPSFGYGATYGGSDSSDQGSTRKLESGIPSGEQTARYGGVFSRGQESNIFPPEETREREEEADSRARGPFARGQESNVFPPEDEMAEDRDETRARGPFSRGQDSNVFPGDVTRDEDTGELRRDDDQSMRQTPVPTRDRPGSSASDDSFAGGLGS